MLPKDPAMLLSVVNTLLRDRYDDLQDLCNAEDVKETDLTERLAAAGFGYDEVSRQFKREERETVKNDCLFCAIAAGEIPSRKVYEDDLCCAFTTSTPRRPPTSW